MGGGRGDAAGSRRCLVAALDARPPPRHRRAVEAARGAQPPRGELRSAHRPGSRTPGHELVFSAPNPISSDDADLFDGWWMARTRYAPAAEPSRSARQRAASSALAHDMFAATRASTRGARRARPSRRRCSHSGDAAALTAGLGAGVAAGACRPSRRSISAGAACRCRRRCSRVRNSATEYGVTAVETCACPATVMTVAAGPVACGAPRGPAATATTETALAAELWRRFRK